MDTHHPDGKSSSLIGHLTSTLWWISCPVRAISADVWPFLIKDALVEESTFRLNLRSARASRMLKKGLGNPEYAPEEQQIAVTPAASPPK